jgi:hypothetical protein
VQQRTTLRKFVIEALRQAVMNQQKASGGTIIYQDESELAEPPRPKPPIFRVVPADYRKRRKNTAKGKASKSKPAPESPPTGE